MTAPSWWYRILYPGDSGPDVVTLQTLLGAPQTGVVDQDTQARLRGRQRAAQGLPDGVCDLRTALLIGDVATAGLIPAWWPDEVDEILPVKLRCGTSDVESAVRRFQSHHHIPPTGVVDETTAIAIGD